MKYGKIENEKLIYAPHRIILDEMQIFNPTPEQLIQCGYKEIRENTIPEEPAPEGYHYEASYEDMIDYINQVWELVKNKEDSIGRTLEERVLILEQNVRNAEQAIERGLTE